MLGEEIEEGGVVLVTPYHQLRDAPERLHHHVPVALMHLRMPL